MKYSNNEVIKGNWENDKRNEFDFINKFKQRRPRCRSGIDFESICKMIGKII
jgi:hypothetical protein